MSVYHEDDDPRTVLGGTIAGALLLAVVIWFGCAIGCTPAPKAVVAPQPDRTIEFRMTCGLIWASELGRDIDADAMTECLRRAQAGETGPQIRQSVHDSPEGIARRMRPVLDRVHVVDRGWQDEHGRPWLWRNISAFQLVEFVAHDREADAEAFLAWAESTKAITIVRVFAMAAGLFVLPPAEGLAALPRTLSLAAKHGLHVEVVALVDTRSYPGLGYAAYVEQIGAICSLSPACILELANEPDHATQDSALRDPVLLLSLRQHVPPRVMVSLGAANGQNDELRTWTGGDFITVHGDRTDGDRGWRYVRHTNEQRAIRDELHKPVENDEPLRDDPDLSRQRAMGWVTATMGLGDCFHFDRGRFAEIPTGPAIEQFTARAKGWSDVPADWVGNYSNVGFAGGPVKSADFAHVVRIYSSVAGDQALAVVLGLSGDPRIEWAWPAAVQRVDAGSAQLWRVVR